MEVLDRMGDFGNYLDTNRAAAVYFDHRPTLTGSMRRIERSKDNGRTSASGAGGGDSNLLRGACFFCLPTP
jgi:hypothetical protein